MSQFDNAYRNALANPHIRVLSDPQAEQSTPPAQPLPQDRYRSNLERRYAARLEMWQRAGLVVYWAYEALKLRLAHRCWYTPDFVVLRPGAPLTYELHEVKGFWREDAKIKFKVAAAQFPYFVFYEVTYAQGAWITTCMPRTTGLNAEGGRHATFPL